MNNIQFRAQRDIGANISAGINFFKVYFKELFPILLKFILPLIILSSIVGYFYQQSIGDSLTADPDNPFAAIGNIFNPLYFLSILISLVASTLMSLLVLNFVKQKAENQNSLVSTSLLFQESLNRVPILILISIAIGVVVALGMILLFVPGVYLLVVFSLIYPIFVMEKGKYDNVFSRAFQLIKGKFWQVLGFLFVLILLIIAITVVFSLPAIIYGGIRGFSAITDPENAMDMVSGGDYFLLLVTLISSLGTIITTPIAMICLSFQYFSLVEEKENVGLFDTINQINKVDE